MLPLDRHRLAIRFAIGSLVAFLVIGLALSFAVAGQLRRQGERQAADRAGFVTDSILRHELSPRDLQGPVVPGSERYAELLAFVQTRILHASGQGPPSVVRIKIWSKDGTVLFSDERRLVGQHFGVDDDLETAMDGRIEAGVTNLDEPENLFERLLATKLFETYVPLRLVAGGRPVAVVEIYQDYAGIQEQVTAAFRTIALTLLSGLGVLYLIVLPIALRMSRTLAEQNDRLEEQAKRQSELLENEQRTVAELRELNRLKGNFVAVASHELRSPLTSIIGYLKTLQRPEFQVDERMREEFLLATERQADRLLQLVQNLLATSQLEDRKLRVSVTPVSFPELAETVLDGLGRGRSRVTVRLPPDLPLVVTDRQHLAQILANLLDNALKYSPDGSRCELGARHEGDSLVFWVSDHGIGIPQQELRRIFDRFYQVDSSSTRRFGGVGLGLSLVKDLVARLGGTVSVTSEQNKGSRFEVTLPLRHAWSTWGTDADEAQEDEPSLAGLGDPAAFRT